MRKIPLRIGSGKRLLNGRSQFSAQSLKITAPSESGCRLMPAPTELLSDRGDINRPLP
jgi:hypothetical protein